MFIAGSQSQPFKSTLNIVLEGDIRTPLYGIQNPRAYSSGTQMGAKAIGVYGSMRLYGEPVATTWTKLAATTSSNTLTLDDSVDWKTGEEVLITSEFIYCYYMI